LQQGKRRLLLVPCLGASPQIPCSQLKKREIVFDTIGLRRRRCGPGRNPVFSAWGVGWERVPGMCDRPRSHTLRTVKKKNAAELRTSLGCVCKLLRDDAVRTLTILRLGGRDAQAHFLFERAAQRIHVLNEPASRWLCAVAEGIICRFLLAAS